MTLHNYKELLKTYNTGDIAFIKSILDGENINYRIKGENFNMVGPLVQPVTFYVQEDQIEDAIELLSDLDIQFIGVS